VAIRADEAWRAGLPALDQRIVGALTRPLRGRFGY
jgi:hypothetical protein